jgi:hypothetical protein
MAEENSLQTYGKPGYFSIIDKLGKLVIDDDSVDSDEEMQYHQSEDDDDDDGYLMSMICY